MTKHQQANTHFEDLPQDPQLTAEQGALPIEQQSGAEDLTPVQKLQDELSYLEQLCEQGECDPEEAVLLQAELRQELLLAEALEEATKPYSERLKQLEGKGSLSAQNGLNADEMDPVQPIATEKKSSELPSLKARRVVRALRKAGFSERQGSGSHVLLTNEQTGATTTVPMHASSELSKDLLRKIVTKDAGLTIDEFKSFL